MGQRDTRVIEGRNCKAYLKDCRGLKEVPSGSSKLVLGACTHLGGWETWPKYLGLLCGVYSQDVQQVLRPDGYFICMQTDAYVDGKQMHRGAMIADRLIDWGYDILDVKIWQRKKADFRQPPFSYVYVCRPTGGRAKRPAPEVDNDYFRGVWTWPAVTRGKLNAWPDAFCRMIVRTFTDPGDLIVDPFAGSCKMLAVAGEMGRHAIGYEIDPDVFPVIEENLLPRGLI